MTLPGTTELGRSSRIVVVSGGGGEGATTVSALLALLLSSADDRARSVVARAEDPTAGRLPFTPASGENGGVIDIGPHADDDTTRAGDVLVYVCAANTAAIARARALLASAETRGRDVAALVIVARTAAEERRGRIRMDQAARDDTRIVPLPWDPALASGRIQEASLAAKTRTAGRRLLDLLAHAGHATSIGTPGPRVS